MNLLTKISIAVFCTCAAIVGLSALVGLLGANGYLFNSWEPTEVAPILDGYKLFVVKYLPLLICVTLVWLAFYGFISAILNSKARRSRKSNREEY